jgi:hypothetical protein
MQCPLSVVLIRIGRNDTEPYSNAVREAFLGGGPTGEDPSGSDQLIRVTEFREFVFSENSEVQNQWPLNLKNILGSGKQQLVLILDARTVRSGRGDQDTDAETSALRDVDSSSSLVLSVFLKFTGSLFEPDIGTTNLTRLGLEDLDERDLRLPFLKLYGLHHALRLLTQESGATSHRGIHLFFSHAKRDGVPITTAAKDWMKRLKGFQSYYDAENLDLEGDIDAQLSKAVAEAVIIVFRTEIFDQRYWCQKEVLWAEQNNRPVITVDARWQLQHGPSLITFDTAPAVRISDGSFSLVFEAALREAVSTELFKVRVDIHVLCLKGGKDCKVVSISRCPSLVSLHQALIKIRKEVSFHLQSGFVVYPNPSLPALLRTAATELADCVVSNCFVLSLDEFRLIS